MIYKHYTVCIYVLYCTHITVYCRTRYGGVLLTVCAAQDNYKFDNEVFLLRNTVQGKVTNGYWMNPAANRTSVPEKEPLVSIQLSERKPILRCRAAADRSAEWWSCRLHRPPHYLHSTITLQSAPFYYLLANRTVQSRKNHQTRTFGWYEHLIIGIYTQQIYTTYSRSPKI